MKRFYLSMLLFFAAMTVTHAQVSLTATGGVLSQSYTTLGAAFVAINAGTHTGAITISVSANTTEAGPCVLNSSGAGSALYTSVSIRPTADAVTISGATTTGRGLIELNGADNVTIDGDNAGSGGINRNLTITNTAANTVTYTSVIRIATSTAVTSADNNIVRNCNINGTSVGGNASGNTSATGAYATSWGIYCGGNGGTTATTAPATLTSTTTNTSASGQTMNALTVNNNQINYCARGVAFMGGATSVSTGVTVTNNTIGSSTGITGNAPYTTAVSTVYVKGILILGTNAVTVTGNTIQDIISYVATDHSGVELSANIGTGTIQVSNNTISNIAVNTGNFRAVGVYMFNSAGAYTVSGNTITNMQNLATSSTLIPEGIEINTAAPSALIEKNIISKLYNNATGAYTATGIFMNGGSNVTVQNNFISDINVYSNNGVTSTLFLPCGIKINSGTGHKIYHNTIHFFGGPLGGSNANGTACLMLVGTGQTGLDIRNNILSNQFSGWPSGSVHACIYMPSGYTAGSAVICNNNAYYAGSGNFVSQLSSGTTYTVANFVASSTTPATNFRAFSSTIGNTSNDNSSFAFSTAAPFVSSANLHIPAATPSVLESGGANIGVASDIDGNTRPGPAGSVNGGGVLPDIGADEFDGIPTDATAPAITYTTLTPVTCGTGDRVLSGVTITDVSGVPTAGGSVPRIYFKKNSDAWVSAPGVLSSGSGTNGVWSFTVSATAMGGLAVNDVVSYYVIAQDIAGTPNISANPGAGIAATNVNTVTTPPTNPNTFVIGTNLNGTYTVGTAGNFATITAAAAAYNSGCLSGPVVFNLITPTYASEVFPIVFNGNSFANSTNTLTIKPAAATAVSVTSGASSVAVFKFLNAKYITIDGLNTGGSSLTLTNGNTGTGTCNIWLASSGAGNSNIALKNMSIIGGNITSASAWGIIAGVDGASPGGTNGADNDNITIQGNTFEKSGYAVWAGGTATTSAGGNDNWVISGNIVGPAAFSATNNMGVNGMFFRNMLNMLITGNTYQNIGLPSSTAFGVAGIYLEAGVDRAVVTNNTIRELATSSTSNSYGILLGGNVINCMVARNKLTGIHNDNGTTGSPMKAITVNGAGATANDTIANNMISDVYSFGSGTVGNNAMGITIEGASGNVNVWYNSVNLFGSRAGINAATKSYCLYVTSSGSNMDVRDNIFVNTFDNTASSSDKGYAVYSTAASGLFSNINYNDYYVAAPNVMGFIASTDRVTLTDMQTGFGGNLNSVNIQPTFVSNADLHLQVVGANVGLIAGTPVGVTTDYDGTVRSGTTPVIGVHEVAIPTCGGMPTAGTVTSTATSGCVTFNTNLGLSGATAGVGISYQWQTSPDNSAYSDIVGATNMTYAANVTSTGYYRAKITCANGGQFAFTPGLLHTINLNPSGITGTASTCVASSTTLASATPSGTWSSSQTSVATVLPSTGEVTGVAVGTTVITYMVTATGCYTTVVATVNATPSAIAITPSSLQTVCLGGSATFTATATAPPITVFSENFNSGSLASWTIDNTGTTNTANIPATQWNIQTSPYTYGTQAAISSADNSKFAMPNADPGGSGSTTVSSITSSPFSLVGYSSATLNFSHFFRQVQAADVGRAQISTDGSSWTTLLTYTTTTGAANGFVNATADISAYVGNPNVRLRFFFSSPWGWYWAIDNIVVNAVPPPAYTWAGASSADLSCTSCSASTITPTVVGSNVYTITATAAGCSRTNTVTVSVNPLPAAIGGSLQVCHGLTTTLTNADGGGTWSSSNTIIATVGSATGVVTGVSPGVVTISYTFTGTGCTRTASFTVNALPPAIGGTAQVCEAATTTLTNGDAGGTWLSANTMVATIGATDGVVSGLVSGTALVTYNAPTGCIATKIVSVNPLPVLSVTPATPVALCIGESTSAYTANAVMPGFTLLNQDFNGSLAGWTVEDLIGPASGQWQIVPTGFNSTTTGDGTPMLQASPMAAGSQQIHTRLVSPSFSTVGFGTVVLSFNQYVLADAGEVIAVEYSVDGGTAWLPLADYTTSPLSGAETWSAAVPNETISLPAGALNQADVKIRWNYNSAFYAWFLDNIKVNAELPPATYTWTGGSDLSCTTCTNPTITPVVTGANMYTVTATSSSSCMAQSVVTVNVNPLPVMIAGIQEVCEGLTTTLFNTDAGGTWTSADDATATVGSSSGVVTGVAAGNVMITYTLPTSCFRTAEVTVNPLPGVISGPAQVCIGLTADYASSGGGTWSSSNTAVGTIDAAGTFDAISIGTTTLTYMLPTGCIRVFDVLVNPLPAVIGGTQSVCEGLTTVLTNADAGGTWTSGNTGIATVVPATGVVTGVLAGNAMITYELPTGCIRSAEVTVNALPASIGGTLAVCNGLTTNLTNSTPGGTWTSGNISVATIDGSGVVTGNSAGTSTITYTITATGCINTDVVTVNALPASIGGTLDVCEGLTTGLTNATAGGTWTSSNTGIATIDMNTGVAMGVSAGNANITYTLTLTGCIRVDELTVNALPAAITGTMVVCEGSTTDLDNVTPSGSWSSSNTGMATVDGAGVVTGVSAGNPVITYTLPTGCIATTPVIVNPLPAVITGTLDVCEGLTTTLGNATPAGDWISGNTGIATVGITSGIVSGVSAGVADITYALATGCMRTVNVTVNALPAVIGGPTQVCATSSVTLTNADAGGTWSSSDAAVATIGSGSGIVNGIVAGSATMTYMLSTGCIRTQPMTVNALPLVYNVTGGGSYCSGGAGVVIDMSNTQAGTTYNLFMGSTPMGSFTGAGGTGSFGSLTAAGTYTAVAVSPESCSSDMSGSATVTIIPLVTPSVSLGTTPNDTVCAGTMTTFTATPVNGGLTPAYAWQVNGVPVSSTSTTHNYVPVNGDVVTVTMTSSEACPSPASVTATQTMVVVSNETPVASITAHLGATILTSADTVCQGTTVLYNATSLFGGTAPVFTWYKNGVTTGVTGSSYSYIPVMGDVITARLNSNYRCPIVNNVSSGAIAVKVDSVFVPAVSIRTNTGLEIKPGTPVTFTATVTDGGAKPTYQWYKNSAGAINGATNATYTTSTLVNNDSITCVVYGTNDCSYYTFNSVRMKVTTGIVETVANSADLRMMPNPNNGEFAVSGTLATATDAEVSFEVVDMLGQVVYKGTAISKGGSLNQTVKLSSTLANGMYMLNVRSGAESKTFHFVLKQ